MNRGEPQPINVAFVGMGLQAARHNIAMGGEVNVVGSASRSGEGAQQGINWGTRYSLKNGYVDAMLDETNPQLVVVSVLPDQHGEIEAKLIDRGIPFMVDKPIGVDSLTVEQTADAVTRAGLFAGAFYQHRASPVTEATRELLLEHPPKTVTMRYYSGGLYDPGIPRWWMEKNRSGGPIVEQAAHVLDLGRALLGDVASVDYAAASYYKPSDLLNERPHTAGADIPTETVAEFTFKSGVKGRLETTAIAAEGPPKIELVFSSSDNSVITWSRPRVTLKEPGKDERVIEELPQTDLTPNFLWLPIMHQDACVLRALRTGNAALLDSTYADAKKTHDLASTIKDISEANEVERVLFAA